MGRARSGTDGTAVHSGPRAVWVRYRWPILAVAREAELDEIASAVVFLASDQAQFVTGIDLPVDAGHSAGSYVAGFDRL